MHNQIDHFRRRMIGAGALGLAVSQIGPAAASVAEPTRRSAPTPGADTTFLSLREIDAGALRIGYAEDSPVSGPVVILLHGWPYDIHSFVDVAPLLASAGFRVIVPYLRGHGTTRFLSDTTMRNGQQAALGADVIALMDALKIERAILAGPRVAKGRFLAARPPPTVPYRSEQRFE